MAAPTLTTRLEAVNTILQAVARAPVAAISPSNPSDALTADLILTETEREVQMRGWHFNTEVRVPLASVGSEIALDPDIARVDAPKCDNGGLDFVRRGAKLYNITNQTFTIEGDVLATVVRFLDFEDLPESARYYIMVKAARRMQDRFLTDVRRARFNREDEFNAMQVLVNDEIDLGEYNAFHNYDSIDIAYRQDGRASRYRW